MEFGDFILLALMVVGTVLLFNMVEIKPMYEIVYTLEDGTTLRNCNMVFTTGSGVCMSLICENGIRYDCIKNVKSERVAVKQ